MIQTLLDLLPALGGGLLIGLAAVLLMALNGQIFGVSGIAAAAIDPQTPDRGWQWALLAGLLTGGMLLALVSPTLLRIENAPSLPAYIISGLLVGYGTRLGSGCPSGHGVCGLSRLSVRSLCATLTFMGTAMLTVFIIRRLGGTA